MVLTSPLVAVYWQVVIILVNWILERPPPAGPTEQGFKQSQCSNFTSSYIPACVTKSKPWKPGLSFLYPSGPNLFKSLRLTAAFFIWFHSSLWGVCPWIAVCFFLQCQPWQLWHASSLAYVSFHIVRVHEILDKISRSLSCPLSVYCLLGTTRLCS